MAQDIVPVLNEKIQSSFKTYCLKDRRLTQISKRIRDGTASQRDAHDYAEHLGENLSRALVSNLTADNLPNGTLYYNIAQRTVIPSLEENYNLINDISSEIQAIADKKAKIGLGTVKADFPSSRINGLIDKMTSDDIILDQAIKWLQEPIVNNSEAFFDDFVKANADFRTNVGLKATITRSVAPGCCKWCEEIAGTYDYDDAPEDIYRRHEFCRCTVMYQSKKTSQNVWSKRTWESSPEELERRENIGKISPMTASERLSQIEQIERDKEISDFVRQTGYSRRTARETTLKKNPDQIAAEIKKIQERQRTIARG
jgi:hypothetical protein